MGLYVTCSFIRYYLPHDTLGCQGIKNYSLGFMGLSEEQFQSLTYLGLKHDSSMSWDSWSSCLERSPFW